MIDLSHYKFAADALGPAKKLRQKFAGSFPVVAVHSPSAIEIRLPAYAHGRIHPVIHPMYLKLASNRSVQKGFRQVVDRHFDPSYPVEAIVAHRRQNGRLEYLVQWEGCGLLQSTWEPEDNLVTAQRVRDRYWQRSQQRQLEHATLSPPSTTGPSLPGTDELSSSYLTTLSATASISLARRLVASDSNRTAATPSRPMLAGDAGIPPQTGDVPLLPVPGPPVAKGTRWRFVMDFRQVNSRMHRASLPADDLPTPAGLGLPGTIGYPADGSEAVRYYCIPIVCRMYGEILARMRVRADNPVRCTDRGHTGHMPSITHQSFSRIISCEASRPSVLISPARGLSCCAPPDISGFQHASRSGRASASAMFEKFNMR
jgi:hypothetical protein